MYTPTKEELQSLKFNYEYDDYHEELQAWHTECATDIDINIKDDGDTEFYIDQNNDLQFYPQSLEDIKTLIRLLTPHEK